MPFETITIINNSGKIISNGKQLFSLFKEAKASYQEKKAAVKVERAIKRSNTYDVATVPQYHDEVEYIPPNGRRASHDDVGSHTSSRRSHRSRHPRSQRHRSQSQSRPALTATNLQTLSEVASTTPSRAPAAYRSPYAETAPRELAMSRPTLAGPGGLVRAPTMPAPSTHYDETVVPTPRHSTYVNRSRSDPSLRKKEKAIDMNLAYGSIPPDLESRVDLDPAYQAVEKERKAHTLMQQIEGLLAEAHCLHHTATHMIKHLQEKPEAAAAVALTLAELSTLIAKMSPGFLGAIKAGSPAVFALLASPQFLIAAGVTVGVTVVMFGGWKIVKRIKETRQLEAAAAAAAGGPMAFEGHPAFPQRPAYPVTESGSAGFDEALVLEEELSTIETWRRGIASVSEAETADMELISPEADRAIRSQYGGDDARSTRTSRTRGTTRTHKTSHTHKSRPGKERATEVDERDVPERTSSRSHSVQEVDGESLADSERSRRSHRSSKSKRTVKTIEDGSRDRERAEEFDLAVRTAPKKDNMLKNLFKKRKDKDEKVKGESMLVPA